MEAVLLRNADRMMTKVSAKRDGVYLTFADGQGGIIPFTDLPDIKDHSNLKSIDLPNPYQVILTNLQGATTEVPWDFARSYCDSSYSPRIEAMAVRGRQMIGNQIRRLRREAGITQDDLATKARISRVTLVRIESGEQSPRYETLVALSQALGRSLPELVTGGSITDQGVRAR